jgi:putative ABC transport system substrate-binding protein
VLPTAARFAVIANPPNPVPEHRRELDAAARAFGISLSIVPVQGPADFETALTEAKKSGATAIIATVDAVTFLHRRALVQLALKHRLPGMYWAREYVEEGGLLTYSSSLPDLRRRAATYVDKILKGAKPADLPVEQPTKFELVINLKTAKALGLTIPPSLLLRADQVIE